MTNKEASTESNNQTPLSSENIDLFWLVAHEDAKVRQAVLAKLIESSQTPKEAVYALKRLVAGLASDRPQVRTAFAAALTVFLKNYSSLTTDDVIEKIESEIEITGVAREKRQPALGRVAGWTALIRSGRIGKDDELVERILGDLTKLRRLDRTVSKSATQSLRFFVENISTASSFKERFWPSLRPIFEMLQKGSAPDVEALVLLFSCAAKYPVATKKRLKADLNLKFDLSAPDFFGSDFVRESFKKAAMEMTIKDHRDQAKELVLTFIQLARGTSGCLERFWSDLLCKELCPGKEKSCLLLRFLEVFLLTDLSPDLAKHILQFRGLDALSKCHQSSKKDSSRKLAKDVTDALCNIVAADEGNKELKITIIEAFVKQESVASDASGGRMAAIVSRLLHAVPQSLLQRTWGLLRKELLRILNCEGHKDNKKRFLWILQQIQTCLHRNSNSLWEMEALQILFLFAHFTISSDSGRSTKLTALAPGVDEFLSHAAPPIEDSEGYKIGEFVFNALLKKILSKDGNIEAVLEFRRFADVLIADNSTFVTRVSSENATIWSQAMALANLVEKQKALLPEGQDSPVLDVFQKLYLVLGFQSLTDSDIVRETLPDLKICAIRACGLRMSVEDSDSNKVDSNIPWVDVMTELLLSFLLRESVKYRKLVTVLLPLLLPYFTRNTLRVITDAISGKSDGENLFEVMEEEASESDEEDEEGEGEKVNEQNENENDDDDDEDDEDDDADDEDQPDATEDDFAVMKLKLATAMGKAAPKKIDFVESNDSDDESEVDDDAMFEFEEKIASVFKEIETKKAAARTKKLEAKQQRSMEESKIKFRLRTLDLVPALISPCLPGELFLDLFKAIVQIEASTRRKTGSSLVSKPEMEHKIRSIIKEVSQFRHGSPTLESSMYKDGVDLLKSILKDNAKYPSPLSQVPNLCAVLVKVLLASVRNNLSAVVETYLSYLEDVVKMKSLKHEHFVPFKSFVDRFQLEIVDAGAVSRLADLVLDAETTSFCRKQLVALFNRLLNLYVRKQSNDADGELESMFGRLLDCCLSNLEQEAAKATATGVDSSAVAAFLSVVTQMHKSRGRVMKTLVTEKRKLQLAALIPLAPKLNKAASMALHLVGTFWGLNQGLSNAKKSKNKQPEVLISAPLKRKREDNSEPVLEESIIGKRKKLKSKRKTAV